MALAPAVAMATSNKFLGEVFNVASSVYVLSNPFDLGGRFVYLRVDFKVMVFFILLFYSGSVAGSQRRRRWKNDPWG